MREVGSWSTYLLVLTQELLVQAPLDIVLRVQRPAFCGNHELGVAIQLRLGTTSACLRKQTCVREGHELTAFSSFRPLSTRLHAQHELGCRQPQYRESEDRGLKARVRALAGTTHTASAHTRDTHLSWGTRHI